MVNYRYSFLLLFLLAVFSKYYTMNTYFLQNKKETVISKENKRYLDIKATFSS